jgi:hypothetical protein
MLPKLLSRENLHHLRTGRVLNVLHPVSMFKLALTLMLSRLLP